MMDVKIIAGIMMGIALGYLLHRTKFCFNYAIDRYLTKKHIHTKLILIIVTINLIIMSIIILMRGSETYESIHPVGLFSIIGGLFLGIGMGLSRGDMMSNIWKSISGNIQAFSALIGTVIGVALFAILFPAIRKYIFDFYLERVALTDFRVHIIVIGILFVILTGYTMVKKS
jgi:uncharacterized membrane protein YedE/YeeE